MKHLGFGLSSLLISLVLLTTCNTTEPPPETRKLILTFEDASCTEVWLKLETENISLPAEAVIKTDDSTVKNIILSSADTIIYVDSLLPNKTYAIQAFIQSSNQSEISSNEVTATTMDTTSHNFTWQTWTFGEVGSSVLYDVTIIDENNIWAVGVIYLKDSLGQPDPLPYNAVHWNGSGWELKRVSVNFRGNIITPPLDGAFSFSETDIWFVGSLPVHGDGENWIMFDLRTTLDPNISVSKAWGINSNDIYFVGRNGSIAWKNGSQWTKIESGISDNFGDIWGIPDGNSGYSKYLATGKAMIILDEGNRLTSINAEPNNYVNLIWGISNKLIYTAGNGIVLYKNNKWEKIEIIDLNTIYGIKGNNYNNVFGISSTSSIFHFNGYNWKNNNIGNNNIYFRLDVKNNLTAAAGWQGDKAIITLLQRN